MSVLSFIAFAIAAAVLVLLPGTGLIGPVFVMGGIAFFGVMAVHYVIWGRWLSRELDKHEQSTED
jgi:hypothetical protein